MSAPGYDESLNLIVEIIARLHSQRYYTTDMEFMEWLYKEVILETMLEKAASDIKNFSDRLFAVYERSERGQVWKTALIDHDRIAIFCVSEVTR